MLLFLLGAIIGSAVVYAFYWRAQREAALLEEEKQALMEERQIVLDFMHDMVDAVGERLPREELFQRIVHAAIVSTGALSACIFERTADQLLHGVAVEGLFPPHRPIVEDQRMRLVTRARYIEQVLKSETFPVGEGIVGRVAATGRGELIRDAEDDPRIVKHHDPALRVRSVIAAPIMVRRSLIGVLCVCNAADGLPFSATDYSLVEKLAEQAGLAVHNADFVNLQVEKQQLDLDLTMASDIQQMLLPQRMPQVPGFDIEACYQPARKVSGDFYDVFALGGTRLGVAVADVSGKGMSASLLMAICRTTLRRLAPQHDSPARVLIELNRALEGDMREGMYITMTYAVFDSATSQVTFARAGHELPLIGRPDYAAGSYVSEFVWSEGMPIGLVDAGLFERAIQDCSRGLGPGETMVLYTDGLTEAPNEEEKEFGGGRLADTLKSLHERPAREINAGILEAVRRFAGGEVLRDDYTLVTVNRV
ncbi:MAG: SpoIIE family protein phosphatase [Opitutaceae bacterium]|nr:SpoIIE family protein phosphatase [Opitutaceae bacterium]